MKNSEIIIVVVCACMLAAVGAGVYCILPSKAAMQQQAAERYELHKQAGYKACKRGVPANANPQRPGTSAAEAWLDGWMEANNP